MGIMMGAWLLLLSPFKFGRKLLVDYPYFFTAGCFSHAGPTQDQIEKASWEMRIYGKGYLSKDKADIGCKADLSVGACWSGPDLGYNGTARIVVQAAYTLLL